MIARIPIHRHFIMLGHPAERVTEEMEKFFQWYNATAPHEEMKDSRGQFVLRAGIAHLWFQIIHPFDHGSGIIGRAITDHALSQALGHPIISGISTAIDRSEKTRQQYYKSLSIASGEHMRTDAWLKYFNGVVNQGLKSTKLILDFALHKLHFFDRYGPNLNQRQTKVLELVFNGGVAHFAKGLSRQKYVDLSHCNYQTAVRDLEELVKIGALRHREGKQRPLHYDLVVRSPSIFKRTF